MRLNSIVGPLGRSRWDTVGTGNETTLGVAGCQNERESMHVSNTLAVHWRRQAHGVTS
jgi:hypothetical protein